MFINNNQRGATLLEFTISALVFFGICSALFDFGVGIRNYALLTEAVSASARESGVYHYNSSTPACSDLEDQAATAAEDYLRGRLGVAGDYTFRASTSRSATGALKMKLRGEWPLSCVFCMFFPRGVTVRSSSQIIFEDPDQACAS